jgi:hypothetical protein
VQLVFPLAESRNLKGAADTGELSAYLASVCADVLVLPSGDLDAVCFEVGQC